MDDEYLKQNAIGNYIEIQQIGCFFRCACNLAEREAKRMGKYVYKLTTDQLNKIWDRAITNGYIGDIKRKDGTIDRNCVKNSAQIATIALQELNCRGKFREVGTKTTDDFCWYGGADKTVTGQILKMKQNGPSKTHYVVVDPDDILLWDPHEPAIRNQGNIYTILYRYEE